MYNHKPKSNAPRRKNHKTADRKGGGGGSTLTVSLTVKYPLFFFDDFPKVESPKVPPKIRYHVTCARFIMRPKCENKASTK